MNHYSSVIGSNVTDTLEESSKMVMFIHELSQSLLVIQAYVNGCHERIKQNNLNETQVEYVFDKIHEHTELMSNQIHFMNHFLNLL